MTRRRRHGPTPRTDLLITIAVLVVVVAAGWLSLRARDGLPGVARHRVTAQFQDLANLKTHDDVRIAGVRVGQVLDPQIHGTSASVELSLDEGVHLSSDTRAVVRSRGLLGARYLELLPGTSSRTLADGATIPMARTGSRGDLTDILDTFDAHTRRNLRELIDGAGRGVLARGGDVNDLLSSAPPMSRDLRGVAGAINARAGAARRLVPSVESAMSAAAPVAPRLARAIAAQQRAAAPFAARSDDVSRTLRVAPGALASTRRSLADTSPLLDAAQDLLGTVRRSLVDAPRGFSEAAALLRSTHRPLARTAVALDAAVQAAPPARAALRTLPGLLTMLDDTFEAGGPLARKVGAIQCDIHTFATGWQSMLGIAVKDRKHDPELGPLTSLRLTVTPTPATLKPLVTAATGNKLIGTNPYPAPCKAGTERMG